MHVKAELLPFHTLFEAELHLIHSAYLVIVLHFILSFTLSYFESCRHLLQRSWRRFQSHSQASARYPATEPQKAFLPYCPSYSQLYTQHVSIIPDRTSNKIENYTYRQLELLTTPHHGRQARRPFPRQTPRRAPRQLLRQPVQDPHRDLHARQQRDLLENRLHARPALPRLRLRQDRPPMVPRPRLLLLPADPGLHLAVRVPALALPPQGREHVWREEYARAYRGYVVHYGRDAVPDGPADGCVCLC